MSPSPNKFTFKRHDHIGGIVSRTDWKLDNVYEGLNRQWNREAYFVHLNAKWVIEDTPVY